MDKATHEIRLSIGFDVNKVVNENTLPTLSMLFNTDNIEQILASYGEYLVGGMVENILSREEINGYDARIVQLDYANDGGEDTEGLSTEVDKELLDEAVDIESDKVLEEDIDVLPLLDSIYAENSDIRDSRSEIELLVVDSKYGLNANEISIDTGIDDKLILITKLEDIDYKIVTVNADGETNTKNIKLPKGEN